MSDLCDITLLDFNSETIEYTGQEIAKVRTQAGRVTPISLLQRSVHKLLRQASTGDVDLKWESYDMVYCSGLFYYLSQRVCRRLNDLFARLLAPGGLMMVTNVSDTNPSRAWMEYVLEWNLIYRDDSAMMEIAPLNGGQFETVLNRDETGVKLFLDVRKKDGDGRA